MKQVYFIFAHGLKPSISNSNIFKRNKFKYSTGQNKPIWNRDSTGIASGQQRHRTGTGICFCAGSGSVPVLVLCCAGSVIGLFCPVL